MQVDQNDDADRRGSQGSDLSGSGNTPQLSSQLRDKLQEFAECGWRIDASSIEFPEDAPEFRGGFATVSRAVLISTSDSESSEDDSTDSEDENKSDGRSPRRKIIAVKKLKIENGKDKERVLGLALREAGFLTELYHENVIELEGLFEDLSEDRVWLVFPWADNGNLKDFVASADWEIPERIWLIHDVARGVEYLHNQNPPIYHGDLKSANVLVNSEYRAIITDFGSTRRLTKKDPRVQPAKSRQGALPALSLETEFCEATNTVTLRGNQFTLRWAAPELLMEDEPGMEPGLWSDIWTLGWVFYEVMMGAIPFQNVQNESVVVTHVIHGDLPSVADHVRMTLIRALYSLMITCWSIDPSKRPTAGECRKSMIWMPMIRPDRQRAANTSVSGARSPEILVRMGDMHRLQNDYINASKFLTEALGIYTETADNAGKADALFGLAEVNRSQHNYSEAVKLFSEVAQIDSDMGNRQGRANALLGIASVHRLQEKYSKAVKFYSKVLQISSGLDDGQQRADALRGLADLHRLQNEYSEAAPLFSKAIQISTNIGDRGGRAEGLWGLAEVHRLQKQYSQALKLFSEVLRISIDIGNRDRRAWTLMCLGDLHRDQDQHEDAIRLYEQAAGIFEEIGDTQTGADALDRAAEAREQLEPAEAE